METNSTDPTPFSTPIRSPEPVAVPDPPVTDTPTNSISDETDCDNNLRSKTIHEEDDVVCANEHVTDAQSDASASQNTAHEDTEQNEITDTNTNALENSTDEVDVVTATDDRESDSRGAVESVTETNETETPNDTENIETVTLHITETPNETEVTENATETQNDTEVAESSTAATALTTLTIEDETVATENTTNETENETNATALPQTEVIVEDALTFDENHFSTPTGASPVTSPGARRRRTTTASSMEDSEVRPGGLVRVRRDVAGSGLFGTQKLCRWTIVYVKMVFGVILFDAVNAKSGFYY